MLHIITNILTQIPRKFWHQSLRQHITSPARWISQDILKLPHGSISRLAILAIAFLGSGMMHLTANLSSGVSHVETGIFQFFFTQVGGILVEDQIKTLYRRLRSKSKKISQPSILARIIGYVWVVAFMIWTVPAWVYPEASKPVAPGPNSVLPFSVVKAIRK